jgi:hypothetical protein
MKYPLLFIALLVSLHAISQSNLHNDTSYYDNGAIREIRTRRNHSLISHLAFEESGELIYQSPLLPEQKNPKFKFVSGRTYFDAKRSDTMVFEKNIPRLNLLVNFVGATVWRITPYSFGIKGWKPQPGTQKGKMVIDIYENMFFKSKKVIHKVVYFDIR